MSEGEISPSGPLNDREVVTEAQRKMERKNQVVREIRAKYMSAEGAKAEVENQLRQELGARLHQEGLQLELIELNLNSHRYTKDELKRLMASLSLRAKVKGLINSGQRKEMAAGAAEVAAFLLNTMEAEKIKFYSEFLLLKLPYWLTSRIRGGIEIDSEVMDLYQEIQFCIKIYRVGCAYIKLEGNREGGELLIYIANIRMRRVIERIPSIEARLHKRALGNTAI